MASIISSGDGGIYLAFFNAALPAYPVLRASEFSGAFFLTANAFHEDSMCLFDQPVAERKLMQSLDSKFSSLYIIDNICHIAVCIGFHHWVKDIFKRGLCALNLRGHKSFFANIHRYEQLNVRDTCRNTFQNSKLRIGFFIKRLIISSVSSMDGFGGRGVGTNDLYAISPDKLVIR